MSRCTGVWSEVMSGCTGVWSEVMSPGEGALWRREGGRRAGLLTLTAERIIGTTLPLSTNCTYLEWAKALWTPHIQHTPSLNHYHLVDATELSERPDTETVSIPKQSISWTLDIKRGTHNTIIQLFIHHTYFFHLHMSDLYTYNCLYCIFCFCYIVHCLYVYCSFVVSVLSCCCHSVALWSFCHYKKFLVCVNILGQ